MVLLSHYVDADKRNYQSEMTQNKIEWALYHPLLLISTLLSYFAHNLKEWLTGTKHFCFLVFFQYKSLVIRWCFPLIFFDSASENCYSTFGTDRRRCHSIIMRFTWLTTCNIVTLERCHYGTIHTTSSFIFSHTTSH